MRFASLLLPALLILSLPVQAQQGARVDWSSFTYLLGEWVGEGGGKPGEGTGTFSHSLDLQNSVIIRKNHVEYPRTSDRPAFTHDDLMIIYRVGSGPFRAEYFDNEGHVIHYTIRISPRADSLVFVSDIVPSAPRFRFTYVKGETLKTIFDIAPPGNPDGFARYVEGVARRKK